MYIKDKQHFNPLDENTLLHLPSIGTLSCSELHWIGSLAHSICHESAPRAACALFLFRLMARSSRFTAVRAVWNSAAEMHYEMYLKMFSCTLTLCSISLHSQSTAAIVIWLDIHWPCWIPGFIDYCLCLYCPDCCCFLNLCLSIYPAFACRLCTVP